MTRPYIKRAKAPKKNLIIAPCGRDSTIWKNHWIKDEHRSFDIWLTYYDYMSKEKLNVNDPKKMIVSEEYNGIDRIFYMPGEFKYPSAYAAIFGNQYILDEYEYIWFPDDDISLSTAQINKMFSLMKEKDLWLAMPSIDGTSNPTFSHQIHQANTLLRYVGFVEVQCPVFSKYALNKCWKIFDRSQSGWGLDLVWPKLLRRPINKIAILDAIVAKHTRKVGGGDLYNRLKIDPDAEMRMLMKEYNVDIDRNIYGVLPLLQTTGRG